MHYELPRAPDIASAHAIVHEHSPSRPFQPWKYHSDFWKERLLARFRMGVLPTRAWAHSMKLCHSPLCRHCDISIESMDHLLSGCSMLDYHTLFNEWNLLSNEMFHFGSLRTILINENHPSRIHLEQVIFDFVKLNKLFKKF